MAESFKMTQGGKAGLNEAVEVFPDLPWKKDSNGDAFVFDEKKDEYVPVNEGDYIVKIGDRFEVSDSEPAKAKPAEPKVEETTTARKTAAKAPESDDSDSE